MSALRSPIRSALSAAVGAAIDPSILTTAGSRFSPLDLFLPGDRGGFYNSNVISSLFQTRTGPTVPVTAPGQPTDFVVDQNGQFNLARPAVGVGFTFNGEGKITPVASDALSSSLVGAAISGVTALTIVQSGYVDMPELNATSNSQAFARNQIMNGPGTVGVQLSATRSGVGDYRIIMLGGGSGRVGDIRPTISEFVDPYVFGGSVDFTANEQRLFFNDTESLFTATVVPPAGVGFSVGAGLFAEAAAVPLWTGAVFFIDRVLTAPELTQLKAWMRANTPGP